MDKRISKYFPPICQKEEDAYRDDLIFAELNGYLEWEKSLPSYTLFQALLIFPEAKPLVKRELKNSLKEVKKELSELTEEWEKKKQEIMDTSPSYIEMLGRLQSFTYFFENHEEELKDKQKRILFNLAHINGKVPKGEIGAAEIERARAVPIPELLPIGRNGKTKCIFHEERTASLHYYRDTNKVYCFSCGGKPRDSVDVVMQLYGIDFITAVKKLCQ